MIIDSDNYAAAGIETLFFPGGEPHAKIPESLKGHVLLFLKLRTWYDVGIAACVLDALERNDTVDKLDVFMPYVPGARQDRSEGLAPLTIGLIADMFYGLKRKLSIFDPHSVIAGEYMEPDLVWMTGDLDVPIRDNVIGVIAPDAGAVVRAELFRNRFYPKAELVNCTKSRDPGTGKLSNYVVPEIKKTGTYIIVDDICDGGGTFNLLADAFKKDKRGQFCRLEMFVSHGIFSKGLINIDCRIERITTTDSWCQEGFSFGFDEPQNRRLEIIKLEQLFPRITRRKNG